MEEGLQLNHFFFPLRSKANSAAPPGRNGSGHCPVTLNRRRRLSPTIIFRASGTAWFSLAEQFFVFDFLQLFVFRNAGGNRRPARDELCNLHSLPPGICSAMTSVAMRVRPTRTGSRPCLVVSLWLQGIFPSGSSQKL